MKHFLHRFLLLTLLACSAFAADNEALTINKMTGALLNTLTSATRTQLLKDLGVAPIVDVRGDPYHAAADGVTDDTAEIQAALTDGSIYLPKGSAQAAAIDVLTFSAQPANNDTVGFAEGFYVVTYTFKTTLTGAANEVLRGASTATAITNLAAAINGGGLIGTSYGNLTGKNESTSAVAGATTLTVTALREGSAGNRIAVSEACSVASWASATLTGGVDSYVISDELICPNHNRQIIAEPGTVIARTASTIAAGEVTFIRQADYDLPASNITIRGGIWDANALNQTRADLSTGLWSGTGFRFKRVTNFVAEEIVIKDTETFAFGIAGGSHLTFRNIWFDSVSSANGDGIHISGPAFHIRGYNVSGVTSDDLWALNADDAVDAVVANLNLAPFYVDANGVGGPIDDVIIEGSDGGTRAAPLLRLLSGKSKITNVVFRDFRCVGSGRMITLGHEFYPGAETGYIDNLLVENGHITFPAANNGIKSDCDLGRATFRNLHFIETGNGGGGAMHLYDGGPLRTRGELIFENIRVETTNTTSEHAEIFIHGNTTRVKASGLAFVQTGGATPAARMLLHDGSITELNVSDSSVTGGQATLVRVYNHTDSAGAKVNIRDSRAFSAGNIFQGENSYLRLCIEGCSSISGAGGIADLLGPIANARFIGNYVEASAALVLLRPAAGSGSRYTFFGNEIFSSTQGGLWLVSGTGTYSATGTDFVIDKSTLTPVNGDTVLDDDGSVYLRLSGAWVKMDN